MRYDQFVKKFDLPPDFEAPTRLTHEDVVAVALTREQLEDDVRGINASLELIPKTRGGNWPEGPVTEEFNYVDLVWHEAEFRDGTSFTYASYDDNGQYLGCIYLYRMGGRTKLTEELLDYDVDVSWWVTPDAYERGFYEKVYAALRHWLDNDFPFTRPYWSNAVIPSL